MGSPLSGLNAEIFLQRYEDANNKHLVDTKNIAFCTRYVGDILIIFDTTKIDSHTINAYINNYLHLTILRKHKKLEVDICRKTTTTDTTINFIYKHPIKQKTAAYRFHITRIQSLPLDPSKKQKEWRTRQSIARNNFPHSLLQKLNRQIRNKIDHTHNRNKDNKRVWATFTYHSPQIWKITNLFRSTKIGIEFKAMATV
jgi:hypothetical protein